MICKTCGSIFPEEWGIVRCNHSRSNKDYRIRIDYSYKNDAEYGQLIQRNAPTAWDTIHARFANCIKSGEWDKEEQQTWYVNEFKPLVKPCCSTNWASIEHILDFSSAYAAFISSVKAHNYVSANHVKPAKPEMSELEAIGRYRLPVIRKPKVIVCYFEPSHAPVMDFSRPSIEAYAKKCDADLIELTGVFHHAWAMCDKWRMSSIAWNYDRALLIDSDILISENAPDIFESFPKDSCQFAGVDEMAHYTFNWWQQEATEFYRSQGLDIPLPTVGINAGVMLFNDVDTMCQIYAEPELPYAKQWCVEQFALWHKLQSVKVTLMDSKWNWAHIRKDFESGLSEAYILHFNGFKIVQERLSRMREIQLKVFKCVSNSSHVNSKCA